MSLPGRPSGRAGSYPRFQSAARRGLEPDDSGLVVVDRDPHLTLAALVVGEVLGVQTVRVCDGDPVAPARVDPEGVPVLIQRSVPAGRNPHVRVVIRAVVDTRPVVAA